MTSVASAIAGFGISLNGKTCTPETLNNWLNNNGVFSGDEFVWGSINSIGFSWAGFVNSG